MKRRRKLWIGLGAVVLSSATVGFGLLCRPGPPCKFLEGATYQSTFIRKSFEYVPALAGSSPPPKETAVITYTTDQPQEDVYAIACKEFPNTKEPWRSVFELDTAQGQITFDTIDGKTQIQIYRDPTLMDRFQDWLARLKKDR